MKVYVQRGRYLKFQLYLYLLGCMSPDVTVILSRMQNICLKPVQLVGGVVTCVICFIVALRLCPVLPVCDPRFCCYLCLVILVIPICVLRLSQTLFDWLIVHLDIFAPFSCGLFSFIFMMFVFIRSGWRSLRLVVLVFKESLELHGGVTLWCRLLVYCAIVMTGCTVF